jgi:hypothetical protein
MTFQLWISVDGAVKCSNPNSCIGSAYRYQSGQPGPLFYRFWSYKLLQLLYSNESEPRLGHVVKYVGPPAAPVLQSGARALDAWALGLDDCRERTAVKAGPGHQDISAKEPEPEDRHGVVCCEQGIVWVHPVVLVVGRGSCQVLSQQ